MPGPQPKSAATRQRRNKNATNAKLPAQGPTGDIPELPEREGGWHELTVAYWRDIWHSPMAHEFLAADLHGLYMLAELVQRYWEKPSASVLAEIRLQRQCYGLTPIDRRRLQWEIERGESAQEKSQQRTRQKTAQREDPRKYLTAVK